jgi:hypothetical protein
MALNTCRALVKSRYQAILEVIMIKFYYIWLSIIIFASCANCEESNKRFINESGSFRIAKVEDEWGEHCGTLWSKQGNKMHYLEAIDLMHPELGDSVYKESGTLTYIFIKNYSSYAQFLNCENGGAILNLKSWKNGDSINIKEIIR